MPPDQIMGSIHVSFCPICLLSTLTFPITFELYEIENSYLACILN